MSPIRRTAWLTEQITRLPPTQRTARALRITPNPRTTQTERTARITRVTARASRKPALRCPYRAQPKAPVRLRPAPEAPAPANKQKREPSRFPLYILPSKGFRRRLLGSPRRKGPPQSFRFAAGPLYTSHQIQIAWCPAQALRTFSVNPADIVTLGSAAGYPPGSGYSAGRWRP